MSEDEAWDGWETMSMQVHLARAGEDTSFLTVRCDRFYLDPNTGRITLWRLKDKKWIVLLKISDYDEFSIDELYPDTRTMH